MRRLLGALGCAGMGAAAGWRAGALTRDGALAAAAVGTAVLAGGAWQGAAALGTFFVSASALTRLPAAEGVDNTDHGGRRARQVLANGGVAGIMALAASCGWSRVGMYGALAAAAADTWATEIGGRWGGAPRLLLSGRECPAGTSGGVTALGLLASGAGAGLLGLVYAATSPAAERNAGVLVGLAGIAGSLADSLLGEVLQERRRCSACGEITEARVHRCGAQTVVVGGISGVDNDVVNLAATCIGAIAALAPLGALRLRRDPEAAA